MKLSTENQNKVISAKANGSKILCRPLISNMNSWYFTSDDSSSWDWTNNEYRIAEEVSTPPHVNEMNPYTVYISGFSYYFLEERSGFISRQIVYFGYSQDVLNDDGTSIKHISNIPFDSDTSLDFTTNNLKVTDTATVNNLVVGEKSFDDIITNKIAEVVADAPEDFDTLKEISDWISGHESDAASMNTAIKTNAADIVNLKTSVSYLNNKNRNIVKYTTGVNSKILKITDISRGGGIYVRLVAIRTNTTVNIQDASVTMYQNNYNYNLYDISKSIYAVGSKPSQTESSYLVIDSEYNVYAYIGSYSTAEIETINNSGSILMTAVEVLPESLLANGYSLETNNEKITKLENRLSTVSFTKNNDGNKTAVFTGTVGHSYRILISHVYNPDYYEALVNLWSSYNGTGGLILIHNYDGVYVSLSGATITVTLSSEHTDDMINAVRFIDEGNWQ